MLEYLVLGAAGFAAGLLNSVAGGGTFLTFPALVWAGVPPISANASATVAALPGYVGSAVAFRQDMRAEGTLGLRAIVAVATLGSIVGAVLLILTPGDLFSGIVPWLLLIATVLFASGPLLMQYLRRGGRGDAGQALSAVAILAVSIYGGYFNGGLGIMLLATFGLLGYVNLHSMNGLKNVLSAILSLVSALTFVVAGLIAWEPALLMAVCSTVGGYVGARQSRNIRTDILRIFVTCVGAVMTVAFFIL